MTGAPEREGPTVLRIITTVEPHVGGPSYSATNAAIAEQRAGVRTTLVSTDAGGSGGAAPPGLAAAGVRHLRFARSRVAPELASRWGLSWPFVRWIARNAGAFDVVHVHYVWSVGTVAGVLAGLAWRRPVVMTPHESLTEFDIVVSRSRLRTLQKRVVRGLLLRAVTTVVVASELERRDSRLTDEQSVVVPHPVATTARPPADGGRPTFDVGFLGRLHEKKRVGRLLDAVASASSPVTLLVGGSHPPEELERLGRRARRLALDGRVRFAGFVPAERKPAFFADVGVLAMPSQYECFGMVAAESMAHGTPVIVSRTCGIADVVERHDAGIVVEPDDDDALRAAIERVARADEDARRAMGRRAHAAAAAELSFAAYGRAIAAVYARARHRGRRGGAA